MIQYSAFITENRRTALTMVQLVRHYRGKVVVFKGEQLDTESLRKRMHRTDSSGVLGRTETTNEPGHKHSHHLHERGSVRIKI
ncbi:hypothetical protein MCGE09_00562 [Thaumarchaeota archaeon SCGC AB-539-E09]|nr:hypothetical protein MCGE09_00562 [Thaumarchaeota archaeon SCGC AB-539-E09]